MIRVGEVEEKSELPEKARGDWEPTVPGEAVDSFDTSQQTTELVCAIERAREAGLQVEVAYGCEVHLEGLGFDRLREECDIEHESLF